MRFVESCWILGDLMCALSYIVGFPLTSASLGNMVLISIDRYVALRYPLQYPGTITRSRVQLCVCLCWACSFLYNGLILKDHLRQPGRYNSCLGECLVLTDYVSGTVDLVVTFFGSCSAIVVTVHESVFCGSVSGSSLTVSNHSHSCWFSVSQSRRRDQRKKAARTLGLSDEFLSVLLPFSGRSGHYKPRCL